MYIHNKISRSRANGPGDRTVVWLQGCTLSCAGCWNPETHAFVASKDILISEVADWILDQDTEGVTFSGGEPFQQAPALDILIGYLKQKRPDISIGSFTGYTHKELLAGKFQWYSSAYHQMMQGDIRLSTNILSQMDFIVAGRYNSLLQISDKPLCGSSNQQVHFLTSRYKQLDLAPNMVEMLVDAEDNTVAFTGFPDAKRMEAVQQEFDATDFHSGISMDSRDEDEDEDGPKWVAA